MTEQEPKTKNFKNNLKKLSEITKWFDDQEEVDVEEGLKKVKEAVGLIKISRKRLQEIENEFEEIKREVETDDDNSRGENDEEL